MNIQIRQAMSLVLLFGGFTLGVSAHAGDQMFSVPCLGKGGKVMNADPASVCQAILPKCADLRKDIEDKVKNLLSLKIYGFYSGYNLDLHTSTTDTPKGDKLQNPICSLVGQKVENHGSTSDFEITSQSISKVSASCGTPPKITLTSYRAIKIDYASTDGSQWVAYLQGAYPWLIRKKTYEVFQKLDGNMSNLNSIVTDDDMTKDMQNFTSQMSQLYQSLSATAKSSCQDYEGRESLIDQCKNGTLSVSDPVARVCKLAMAELFVNQSMLVDVLVSEIMNGTDGVIKRYDSIFGQVLNFTARGEKTISSSNQTMLGLLKRCENTGGFVGVNADSVSSCLRGEGRVGPWLVDAYLRIADGNPSLSTDEKMNNALKKDRASYTFSKGIRSVIEKLIRHDVCGQNRFSDKSVCDAVGIPSKPDGVKW